MKDPAAPHRSQARGGPLQQGRSMTVTFDLFSALVDSRTGGTAALVAMAAERGWDVDPAALYDRWDAANKATSARDVRGALEAGLDVVRLERPGHVLDPEGPRPAVQVADLHDVVTVLDRGTT